MKIPVVIAASVALLAAASSQAAMAHNGKHWTERQAERNLIRYDLGDRNGNLLVDVTDAVCYGYGHNFTAWNGYRVYSKFSCAVYHSRGAWCIDYWVRRGSNATWIRDDPRWCF